MNKAPFHVSIVTLFPDMFPGHLGGSLSGKALDNNKWSFNTINPRDFATDNHKTVDDTPFGGGAGMVMKPDVMSRALESCAPHGRLIYLSPRGTPLTQKRVQALATDKHLTLLCGRYEGIDQRVLDYYQAEEISIGDYILSGGEPAAMILLDAVIRLLPDVIGNQDTHSEESFTGGLLEYPHYTRPAQWTAPDGSVHTVPDVLCGGHHDKISQWRRAESAHLTRTRRPDLWEKHRAAENGEKDDISR